MARSLDRRLLTPSETVRSASMSRPESVSSRIASSGSRTAIWRISFRFFSPPEKPSFTGRLSSDSLIWTRLAFSLMSLRKSAASRSCWPRCLRIAFSAFFRKYVLPTPGISTGYWKARKTPSRARSSGDIASRSLPLKSTEPSVTLKPSRPDRTCASVDLPEPFGPIMATTSPAATVRVRPLRTGLSPAVAWRFLISSMLAYAALERDVHQFLGFHRELHREFLEDLLAEAVDD